MLVGSGLGKFEEQRAQYGHSRTRHLLDSCIEIKHQLVTFFNVTASDVFLQGSVDPWLALSGPFLAVIAINGLKCCQLRPFGEELGGWIADEAAYVRAAHSKPAEAKVLQRGSGQAQMIPGAAVVASPSGGVALTSGVGSARQNERTLVGRNLQQSFVSGARILHAINIVNLTMAGDALPESRLIDAMLNVVGNGLVGRIE